MTVRNWADALVATQNILDLKVYVVFCPVNLRMTDGRQDLSVLVQLYWRGLAHLMLSILASVESKMGFVKFWIELFDFRKIDNVNTYAVVCFCKVSFHNNKYLYNYLNFEVFLLDMFVVLTISLLLKTWTKWNQWNNYY